MLQPFAQHKDLNADSLRQVIALRDESIKTAKIDRILLNNVNRNTVLFNDDTQPQPLKIVADYLKAPAAFLASADFNLAQHIVDHQFNKVKEKREIVFRQGKAIGDQPTESMRISGSQIVEKMIAGVGEVRRASVYDMGNHIDVTLAGDKVTLKPKVNDITEGGLRCLYSEILARAPTLEPYVERLVCTNGMVVKQRIQAFQFDTMDEFLKQFDDAVVSSLKYVDEAVRMQLQKAAETKVERSEQALRHIFESNRITPLLLPNAIAALTSEDDGTAFGVLQAITRSANSADYTRRVMLQQTSAKEMARLETVHCPTCWSSLVH